MIKKDDIFRQIIEDEIEISDSFIDPYLKERMFNKINASISVVKSHKTIYLKAMRWAAVLLLPIISAVVTYQLVNSNATYHGSPVTLITGNGEKAEITLPDGSRAWLNSGSQLTYNSNFNHTERSLMLSGEAYFEVSPNENKPFIVHTKDITIEALGTSFNVTAYEEDQFASSVLIEGSISVSAGDQIRLLSENHRATYYKASGTLASDAVFASDYIMWKDGFLYFNNNSFEEIAQKISRMFNVKIEFNSDDLRSIRFTGTLGNSSIKNVLDILSLTSPLHYEMNGTVVELYYRE